MKMLATDREPKFFFNICFSVFEIFISKKKINSSTLHKTLLMQNVAAPMRWLHGSRLHQDSEEV